MKIPLFQVDAFTTGPFTGNPAAVCPLEGWLDGRTMQAIAAENNLSETAFIVRKNGDYDIRWFTPAVEVNLCDHATLASGLVVLDILERGRQAVTFHSKSGPLAVYHNEAMLAADFPARHSAPAKVPATLLRALSKQPKEFRSAGGDYMAVYEDESDILALEPDMALLSQIGGRGLIVTGLGSRSDFVSRFFAPGVGVPEDPVTGSAHCALVPYWANRLGKTKLHALQLSRRGGELFCEEREDRVVLCGRAVKFLEGTIELLEQPR